MTETIGTVAARVLTSVAPDLPCGVYFRLDENAYHADVALGSGDIRRLAINPFNFWWKSRFNPNREVEAITPAMLFGRAVHTAVLEGIEKFRFMYAPTDFSGSTKAGKEERERISSAGMTALKRDDYDHICLASGMIRSNPHLSEAFAGGEPEVSVFWERDGIKRKARLDYVKARSIVDLKSIRNSREIDFKAACRSRFAQDRYYAQAEHYCEARRVAAGFIQAGQIFGDAPDSALVDRLATAGDSFAFVYVFWQAEDSPLTYALTLSPNNPILAEGRLVIERAEQNWRTYLDQFGIETPWVLADPPEEADINDFPAWSFR